MSGIHDNAIEADAERGLGAAPSIVTGEDVAEAEPAAFPVAGRYTTIHTYLSARPGSGARHQAIVVHPEQTWTPRSDLLDDLSEVEHEARRLAEGYGCELASEPTIAGTWEEFTSGGDLDELDDFDLPEDDDEWEAEAPQAPPQPARWDDPAQVLARAIDLVGPVAVARAALDYLAGDDRA